MGAEQFGARLRQLREAAGLSQTALAARAGMSRGGIAHLELGRRWPTWEKVLALADALGVATDAFRDPPARGRPKRPADKTRREE